MTQTREDHKGMKSKMRPSSMSKSLECLDGSNWVSGSIIDEYIDLIVADSDKKIHSLQTGFWSKLQSHGYHGVKDYHKKSDIFEKDMLMCKSDSF